MLCLHEVGNQKRFKIARLLRSPDSQGERGHASRFGGEIAAH
jgi:hypothetical protein